MYSEEKEMCTKIMSKKLIPAFFSETKKAENDLNAQEKGNGLIQKLVHNEMQCGH